MTGYYSSTEKDILRDRFDLPLLRQFHDRKEHPLSYFGLPGADALDIKAWREHIGEVGAVEKNRGNLELMEQSFETYLPEVRIKTHYGEVDEIILSNRGKPKRFAGQHDRPWVGNHYEDFIRGHVWRFDVVYLDYFGTFLPSGQAGSSNRAQKRTSALRRLFDKDRVDAWQPWILLITVEARLYGPKERNVIRSYLVDTKKDASNHTRQALDFLLSPAPTPVEEGVRLIHGATALLVADAAKPQGLKVKPRGTVLYSGANGRPMVHMAFEFDPSSEILSGTSDRLALLRAPILQPMNPSGAPWVELLPVQCPGITRNNAARCLDFLAPKELTEIVRPLP